MSCWLKLEGTSPSSPCRQLERRPHLTGTCFRGALGALLFCPWRLSISARHFTGSPAITYAVVRWQHCKGRIFTRIRMGFSPNTQIRQARDPRRASSSEIICVFGVNLLLICVRILLFVPGRRLAVGRPSSHKLGCSYQRSSPAIIVVDVLAPQTERFG